jgi:transcriptional regulator with XRE-family HTH domain
MTRKVLASLIKERRRELNISQIDLAELSDVSVRQLSDIETQKASPTVETLSKICETLGLSIELKVKGSDV